MIVEKLPDLEKVLSHLSYFSKEKVLVQEVLSINKAFVPILETGVINSFHETPVGLYLKVGKNRVLFSNILKEEGVSRVATNRRIIYENEAMVAAWDSLFKGYESRLMQSRVDFLEQLNPLRVFKQLCKDRIPYMADYQFEFRNNTYLPIMHS